MSEIGAPPDRRDRLRAAEEIGAHIRRTLRTHRTYSRGHEVLLAHLHDLFVRVEALLAIEEPATLEVTAQTIVFDGKPIVRAEERATSITLPLFLDGVHRLDISAGLTEAELQSLMALWFDAIEGREASEQSFITRFWEAELDHIGVLAVETFVQGEEDSENLRTAEQRQLGQVDAVITTLSSERLAGGARGEAARSRLTRVSREDLAVLQMDEVASLEGQVLEQYDEAELGRLAGVPELELQAMRDEANDLARDPVGRVLRALVEVLDASDAEGAASVQALARQTFTAMAAGGEFVRLAAAIRGVISFARQEPSRVDARCRALVHVLAGFEQPEVIHPIVDALDDPGQAEAAAGALAMLTPRSAEELLGRLPTLHTEEARGLLQAVLLRQKPAVSLLAGKLEACEDPQLAAFLFDLGEKLGGASLDAVLSVASGHAAALVRRRAAQLLVERGAEGIPALLPMISDPEAAIRKITLDAAMRAGAQGIAGAMRAVLGRPEISEDERRRLIIALGKLGGREASLALQHELLTREDVELKIACILALGRCGDPRAIPAIQEAGGGLFTSRQLKEAVAEALRRLEESLK